MPRRRQCLLPQSFAILLGRTYFFNFGYHFLLVAAPNQFQSSQEITSISLEDAYELLRREDTILMVLLSLTPQVSPEGFQLGPL